MGFLRARPGKALLPAIQLNDRVPPYMVPPGQVGKPYRSDWDMQRATEFGLQTNVWVMRCINHIANTQARLPMIMRQGNPIDGPYVDHPMLDLFNFQSSLYESALIFRKRISQVLLLNKQGVMIEIIRNRMGGVAALYILPPGFTWPVPNEQTFVSAFRVQFPGKGWVDVPAENVIWIREPHPTDPYSGQTPLEAAGLSVETDYYMRLYRRNFLQNDGRPGGVLMIKGQVDELAAMQLRQRFYGTAGWGAQGAGRVSVMNADDAAYVDMSQTPREAQYVEGSQVTRDEILEAFGVPESQIGKAADRTFANAEAEGYVFWSQTMLNHLDTIAKALDALDPDPKLYLGFDLSRVTALQLPEQEERKLMLQEVQAGPRAYDEYRLKTGMVPVGGGASKLRAPATAVEVADVSQALIPDWEQKPNAFQPSLVMTGVPAAPERKALPAGMAEDDGQVEVAVYPHPGHASNLARQWGCKAEDVRLVLFRAGQVKDWEPLDLADLERVVGEFCTAEAPMISRITADSELVITPKGDGAPQISVVASQPLIEMRDRLIARLHSEGLRPTVSTAA